MDFSNLILFATEQAAEYSESAGIIGTLGINWKLFIAQLVNFAIVFFILWRWVFRPVVSALESRRRKIEDSVAEAEAIKKRVLEFENEHKERLKKVSAEAEEITKRAAASADEAKRQTLEQTREETERLLADAKSTIDSEKQKMLAEVREEVATLTVMATEKILRERLDEKKDKEFVREIIRSLK